MDVNNQPLVSVPVITYNSAKFVLETLESIKAQTYQNIELIISDDCSTDNTVELCQQWVEQNENRFVRTQIITSEVNTGVSANLNRAEATCQGEWVKPIAGDDLLKDDCVENFVCYVKQHPDFIYVFGKIEVFTLSNEKRVKEFGDIFDYSVFQLDIEKQLERLIFVSNFVPAVTCFYNRKKAIELGIINDERIPMLEDWPKWINILEKGVKLEFMDKVVVEYRIGDGLSTTKRFSSRYYESLRLMHYYYLYPKWYEKDKDIAILRSVEDEMTVYNQLLELEDKGGLGIVAERDKLLLQNKYLSEQLYQRQKSLSYRLGYFLLHPISTIISKIKS